MRHPGRLGVVGGTFDPIHWGHLDAAVAAASQLNLTQLLFVPSHVPPHRAAPPRASAFHRFAMTALAVQHLATAAVSDVEVLRPGPSFSVETLSTLHATGWRASQIFFIIGSDAFAEIATWRSYPALLDMAHFVVISRAGATTLGEGAMQPSVVARLSTPDNVMASPATTHVIPVTVQTRPVSSTAVRERIAAGMAITELVPPSVDTYIARHELYRPGWNLA